MTPNPDHLLGFARFIQNYPEIDVSLIAGAMHAILADHDDLLETLSAYEVLEGPADAITTMLEELTMDFPT